jgi:metallo-beta-lactamase class B
MPFRFLATVLVLVGSASALSNPDWTSPFPPFHIAGNLYYVGSRDLAAFLITTRDGNILINSNLESSVPQIQKSVEQLGFRFRDTRILLISHAHFDHCAGSAQLKKLTGARYMVMDADVSVVESGGRSDFQYGKSKDMWFPATKVDRILHDGDEVRLGGSVLVARKTAGHTKGCTTWTLKVTDKGKTYDAVIVGSPNVNPGYRLANNARYPHIAADYEQSFLAWQAMPCDLFLGAHGGYFGMLEKVERLKDSGANPFVDPAGYHNYITEREHAFRAELAKKQGGK